MEAGNLRYRVSIYGKVKSTNELDEVIYVDAVIANPFAEIVPQTGNMQSQQVKTALTNVTHKINIRYNKLIEEAYQNEQTKSNMHIKYSGHRFDILFVLNPYFQNKSLEIFVEEVIG